MDLLAKVAQCAGQAYLYLGMDVFRDILKHKFTPVYLTQDVVEFFLEQLLFILRQQPDIGQHGDVCLAAKDIVFCQPHIHFAVAPNGEIFNGLRRLDSFVPKCLHG